jgi:iron(III) transport system permease protein
VTALSSDLTSANRRRARFRLRWQPWTLSVCLVALAVAAPIVIVFSHVARPNAALWQHLASTVLGAYVGNSLGLMLGVGIGVVLIGVPAAWMVTLCRFPGRRLFEWALLLPMAMPAYVVAYTYTGLLDYAGPVQSGLRALVGGSIPLHWLPNIRNLPGSIVILTLVFYPYVYLLARTAFLEQSACVLEVSRTLGCSPWRCFYRVALPLARPAIVAGVALAMMEALNDFGTVQYFGVDTMATGIFRVWLGLGDADSAAQLASVLLIFVFFLVVLERWSRGRQSFAHSTTRYRPLPRFQLKGWHRFGAIFGCSLPIMLGFFVPGGMLTGWALNNTQYWLTLRFLTLIRNSFSMAGLAAVIAVMLAMVMAYALRLHASRLIAWAVRIASIGYAVPGSVLAIGVLLPFATIDHALNAWMKLQFGITPGLVLSGTLVAITYAYLVRFLTGCFNVVESSLGKITRSMDFAARSLGRSPGATLIQVHLPIMRGGLLTAMMLTFVEVLKELPATLVLRPFNFDTLATKTYDLASDERLAEAAGPSLAIAVVGILPVIILSRAIAKSRPGGSRDRRPVNTTEDGLPTDDLAVTDQYLPSPAHPIGANPKTTTAKAASGAAHHRQRAS